MRTLGRPAGALLAAALLAGCGTPAKPAPPGVTRPFTDQPPTLTVVVRPEQPASWRAVTVVVRAFDDTGFSELVYDLPELAISRSEEMIQVEGEPAQKLSREIRLVPDIVSKRAASRLGDRVVLKVVVYDTPGRQSASAVSVVRLRR